MENKIYTEDDLHSLVGEAIQAIRAGLNAPDLSIRFSAAVQFLQTPVLSALIRAQEAKMQFPTELYSEQGHTKIEKKQAS